MRRGLTGIAALTSAVLLACAGCGGASAQARTTLTVLAASSLTDAFSAAEHAYEKTHPRVDVRVSFAGSQHLAAQVDHGVPADVIAAASPRALAGITDKLGRSRVFAYNTLVVAVAPGNPRHVDGLADLARRDLQVVLAAPEVPAGGYAREMLRRAGVRARPDSLEPSVRAVLTRVRLGEADAGIVYATDAAAARDDVDVVRVPPAANVRATYPAAVISGSHHSRSAREYLTWLRSSPQAAGILRSRGFGVP